MLNITADNWFANKYLIDDLKKGEITVKWFHARFFFFFFSPTEAHASRHIRGIKYPNSKSENYLNDMRIIFCYHHELGDWNHLTVISPKKKLLCFGILRKN